MDEKEQVQFAFTLWQQLAKTETLLWNQYYKEFLELLLEKEKPPINKIQEFVF
jgi:hypothetical protein